MHCAGGTDHEHGLIASVSGNGRPSVSGSNYWALGIDFNTDNHRQEALTKAPSTHGEVHAETIPCLEGIRGEWYATLCDNLRLSDFFSINKNERTKVEHVIMWVGPVPRAPTACRW